MATEAGEFIVAAYLQEIHGCGVILYNARLPGGKLAGLQELDVVGLNLPEQTAYLCEVTTHLDGMGPKTCAKVARKHEHQQRYAREVLNGFKPRFMLWSPLIGPRRLADLRKIETIELVVNEDFTKAVEKLRAIAKKSKHDMGNPFMRTMQILEHLKPAVQK